MVAVGFGVEVGAGTQTLFTHLCEAHSPAVRQPQPSGLFGREQFSVGDGAGVEVGAGVPHKRSLPT